MALSFNVYDEPVARMPAAGFKQVAWGARSVSRCSARPAVPRRGSASELAVGNPNALIGDVYYVAMSERLRKTARVFDDVVLVHVDE